MYFTQLEVVFQQFHKNTHLSSLYNPLFRSSAPVSWWNIQIRQFLHGLLPSLHGLAAQHGTGLQWLPHYGFGNSSDVPRYSLLIPPVFSVYSKNLNMFFIP
nr:MAG TPA: hypothetical protein [Caudoviricetes sp.]